MARVMKRFTETTKWSDPWFRRLPPRLKCLWSYICDTCDSSGVFEPDWEQASFVIGEAVTLADLESIKDRLHAINGKKWVILKFIPFQYGKLTESCPAHRPIFAAMLRNGIGYDYPSDRVRVCYQASIDAIPIPTGKERTGKEEDKTGKGKEHGNEQSPINPVDDGKGRHIEWEHAEAWLKRSNENGADYVRSETRSAWLALEANGWMWGKNTVQDWRAALERQIQTDRNHKPAKKKSHGNL